jgi:hypothetical protein
MDDADIFHIKVKHHGGRLDMATLHPYTAEGLDYVAGRARGFLQSAAAALPKMPPIHFDFVDSWSFNAWAIPGDSKYFIGVTRGAVAALMVLFDRMLADRNILPFTGNPEEEVADLPLLPDIGTDFVRSVASVPEFPRPRNPARQATARRLAELALDFLTAHEFAHIANGHLDYRHTTQGTLAIDEVSEAPRGSESALINQTMEMDADGTAVLLSLFNEWGRVTGQRLRPGPEWQFVYSRPGLVSLQWSWAVSSLFRLFGETRLTDGDVTLEYYPRPRLRSVMIQQTAQRIPKPQGLDTHPAFFGAEGHIPIMKQGQLDVERIFSQLTGQPEATEGLDEAWGDIGRSQVHRLQDYWRRKLKGKLLTFAHQPLSSYGDPGKEATGESF